MLNPQMNAPSENIGHGPIRRTLLALLLALAFIHPIVIYLQSYLLGDCDDKAVHYFASAFLAANDHARQSVIEAMPAWMDRLSTPHDRLRLAGRIAYAKNYVAADTLIRAFRAWMLPGRTPGAESGWYELPVKRALLTMLVAAMIWLMILSLKLPNGPWFVLIVLCLVASDVIQLKPVVPMPAGGMHPLTSYVPRGSACLMVLAMLLAFATRRPWLVAVSGTLLVLWHAGFGILVLPVLAIVFLIAQAPQPSRTGRMLGYIVALAVPWGISLSLLSGSSSLLPATKPAPPPFTYLPDPVVVGLSTAILILLIWLCLRIRFLDGFAPGYRAFFFTGLIFLATCQGIVFVQRALATTGTNRSTRIHLIYEIPTRLSGIEYLVGVAVASLAVWYVLQVLCGRFELASGSFLRRPVWQFSIVLFFVAAFTFPQMDAYEVVVSGRANFFACDCYYVPLHRVATEELKSLDPRLEPEFFYSLAEYLFESGSDQPSRQPERPAPRLRRGSDVSGPLRGGTKSQ